MFENFDYTIRDHDTDGDYVLPYDGQYYELVTCNFPGRCPDGDDAKNTCRWQRALYVSCEDDDPVEIEIETNSLPNHCYYAPNNAPIGSDTDFQTYGFDAYFNLKPSDTAAY